MSVQTRPLKSRDFVPLLLATAIFLLLYSFYSPVQTLIQPDSAGYLDFSAKRSGGYPFFLSALSGIVRGPGDYTVVQRLFYAIAVLLLCFELLRCVERPVIAWLCAVALLFNVEVNRYHFSILTESTFLSVSALFFAGALSHLRAGRLVSLIAAALAVGALIAIRPAGLGFIPALLLLPFAPSIRRLSPAKLLLAAIAPVLAVTALEWSYYRAHHPGPRQSLAPEFIMAKAGLAEAPGALSSLAAAPPEARPLMQALDHSLAPVRKLIAEAPNEPAHCQLLVNYEVFVQFTFAPDERKLATAHVGQRALATIGLERLRHDGASYLRHTLDNLYCMWTLGAATAQERSALGSYIDAHSPIPFERGIRLSIAGTRFPPAPLVVRWGMLGLAALLAASASALLVVILRGRRPSFALAFGGLCSIAVHATLLFTAMTAVWVPRYVLGLWVPLALGTGFSAVWLMQRCIGRTHPAAT